MEQSLEKVKKEAQRLLSKTKESHGWDHTERVYNLCLHLGRSEKANLQILQLAALLHDIGRSKEDKLKGQVCHAQEGAVLAAKILKKLGYQPAIIKEVAHCIACHRFRDNNIPQTKEAKILFDADKLDSIGAVGIGRAFLFAGEIGARLHNKGVDLSKTQPYTKEDTAYREFVVKLKKVKARLLTKSGKALAQGRHNYMVDFFKRLNQEVAGKL